MFASKSLEPETLQIAPKPATRFRQPHNCPVVMCPAIVRYEQELERHRETESRLGEKVLRESELLRHKDDLILQKDILSKESEHRLLNGLQLINSVLTMQSRNATNPETAAQLTLAANRVLTLARVHRHLHAMDTLESVDFKQSLERLCRDLSDMVSSDSSERTLFVEGEHLTISRVTATPLAFIASELITNSLKYARGSIAVSLLILPKGQAALTVCDDGPGLPEAFDPAATKGLGMKIISALVRQIHGELDFARGDHDHGTRFSVRFNPQA
ncbi:MAG: sensor histidine kinase [Hoeflea sp.]|uniref:sensor histidine kinase n=1 Tax=Hoeflea sp. TaxID=1940281 RepID=UPI001D8F7B37|nr:sensor histidine kinase [Hoeflea sp.]MBU4527823.1 sensor histidine kinase [Alphaproteobacteria bacterium]MBU4546142.1 sensor histidine kinase [Alphaproteobacteria bacterium]MBU4553173.1 sensor histidine kinase [Alphaproteobacteria bacterium]MBV1724245.1 sensor histidine kinase [Hoeflea sp.]MBV1759930.1 sensor histidine kinase [Hoeflea sp.]